MFKYLAKLFYSEYAYNVYLLLDDASQWKFRGEYCISYKGTEFWMGNGAFFFDTNGQGHIGLIERHILYRKANKMRSKLAVRLLLGES